MSHQKPQVLEKSYTVTEQETIRFLGSNVIPVLSTPSLVNWMELTCRENAGLLLKEGEDTLGISVEIKHLAPTPIGLKVRVVSTLEQVAGRVYSFEVEAFDNVEKVAEAKHLRASIAVAQFSSRVAAKKQKASG